MKSKKEITAEKEHDFESLVSIVKLLRSKDGCPWDREQDHKSIRKCLIEETYEVIEAIDTDNPELLREELGDLLLQIVFHSELEAEQNSFDINGVIDGICGKMIHRHPHVFGEVSVSDSAQVLSNWDAIKKDEKHQKTVAESLKSVPPYLPALIKAQKLQGKAKRKLGYAADTSADLLQAAKAAASGDKNAYARCIFALCSAAEEQGIDLEAELNAKCREFTRQCEMYELGKINELL